MRARVSVRAVPNMESTELDLLVPYLGANIIIYAVRAHSHILGLYKLRYSCTLWKKAVLRRARSLHLGYPTPSLKVMSAARTRTG